MAGEQERIPDSIKEKFVTPSQRVAHYIFNFMRERGYANQEFSYSTIEGDEITTISKVRNGRGKNVLQVDFSQPRRTNIHWIVQIKKSKTKYEFTRCRVRRYATQQEINDRQQTPNAFQFLNLYLDLRNLSKVIHNVVYR